MDNSNSGAEAATNTEKSSNKALLIVIAIITFLLLLCCCIILAILIVSGLLTSINSRTVSPVPSTTPTTIYYTPTPTYKPIFSPTPTPTSTIGVSVDVDFDEEISEKYVSEAVIRVEGKYKTTPGSDDPFNHEIQLDAGGNESLVISSSETTLTMSVFYEAETVKYPNYTRLTGSIIPNLGRNKEPGSTFWNYVNDQIGSSCEYLGESFSSPCGTSAIFKTTEPRYIVYASCEGNVNVCDSIMKTVKFTRVE